MRKLYLLHLFFVLLITSSVFGFNPADKNLPIHNNNINFIAPPSVDFTFTNDGACSGAPVSFNPVVSGGAAPYKYVWNFGDGTPNSTESNPSHSYTALGCGFQNFNVTLTVTDANGEVNSRTRNVSVKQKPDLRFTDQNNPGSAKPFERCGDNNSNPKYTINVGNNSASVGCISAYNVDWGDGTSEANVTFPKTHEYQKLGSFNMVITANGSNGCSNSITYVVKNSNNPIGALIAPGNTTNLCIPVPEMNFAIGSWGLNPSDTNYQVNYGDGTVQSYSQAQLESSSYYNSLNPQASQNFPVPHKFTRANCPSGNTVSLTITTSCGSTYLTAGPIIILDVPVISFSIPSIACANSGVYFNNSTYAGYTNGCSTVNVYTWDFGDGTTSREVNPYHVYTRPGQYKVTLNATTPCGVGITPAAQFICVEPILEPNFTYGNACASTNLEIKNTTDTSLSCGTETYYWEVYHYVEGFCGKEAVTGTGRGQWNFANGTNYYSKDPVFNFIMPGTYYVRLTTRNSCGIDRSISKEIQVKKPPVITLAPISDFCNSATIKPVGKVEETCAPINEITYKWTFDGGTPSSSTSLNPGSINYTTSGDYKAVFEVTNSCGTTRAERNFSVNTVLSPVITAKTLQICSGSSFQVTPFSNGTDNVPAGTTYIWSTPVVSPPGAVSGANAQSSPVSTISQFLTNNTNSPATVTYTISPISKVCPGPNFTITVTVDPLIKVVETIKTITCFGLSDGAITITAAGGIPFPTGNPYTFSWTGPNGFTSSDQNISNLRSGYYNLRVTDNGKCPFVRSYFVREPDQFQILSQPKTDITCFGANDGRINLNVIGGTQPYKYVWTKDGAAFPVNSGNLSNLTPGKYDVTITEANSCNTLTGSYTIIEPPLLELTYISQTNILCYGYATGEINVKTVGGRVTETSPGVFNYRYRWTGPNGYVSTVQNPRNLFAGTYNLTVTDNSGCTDNLQVVVLQNDEIKLNYTKTEIACYNYADASITINSITGGVPFATGDPYIIKWSNLGTGLVQNNLSAGTYIITITDSLGCPKVFTIIIDNAPVFTINPNVKQITCFGQKDAHIRLNLVGGKAPVKLVWDDDATAGIERNNIGPGDYSVTITDAKNCQIKETFKIVEPLLLEIRADVSNPLECERADTGQINLVVTGGTQPYSYSWSNGQRTEDLANLVPGKYTVTVTDANGCKQSDTWTITRFDQLTPTVEVLTDFNCETKYVKQTFVGHVKGGIPPYTLSWSDGVITGANNEIMNTENNGLIIFSVTDSFGCKSDYALNVDTPVLGEANFSTGSYGKEMFDLYSIYDPVKFTNMATGDFVSTSWDFGDGVFSTEESPEHIYTRVGTYTIKQTVNYPFGCQYSYSATIVVEKGYSLIMPNAFTPNNDGFNDTFAPVFLGLSNITLDVFDTWGAVVYSESGINIRGWNGKIKDLDAENGNYYYKITLKTFYNHTVVEKGPFTLIK